METVNIVADNVALALKAADRLDDMGKQIIDPKRWADEFHAEARGVRFVVENFRTLDGCAAEMDRDEKEARATAQQAKDVLAMVRSELNTPEGRSLVEVATERTIEIRNLKYEADQLRKSCLAQEQNVDRLTKQKNLLHDATIMLRNEVREHSHCSKCVELLRKATELVDEASRLELAR